MKSEPDNLNPPHTTDGYSSQVVENIFSHLLAYDPLSKAYTPKLVEAMPTVSDIESGPWEGGKSYAFRIHDAAVWENGSPVTGYDFSFTLKAVFNPAVTAAAPYRAYLSFIRDVQVNEEDPKSFVVFTSEPYVQALEYMGNALPVLPAYHFDPEGKLSDFHLAQLTDDPDEAKLLEDANLKEFANSFADPKFSHDPEGITGSGPYRLVSWETGSRLRLEKKENWWGDALADKFPNLQAYPEGIVYQFISDDATAAAALEARELDVDYTINPNQFLRFRESTEFKASYNLITPDLSIYYFLYVNERKPLLEDNKVRKALAHSINVDELISGIQLGLGTRVAGPVPPSASYHNDELVPYTFDPDLARELLREAGWEDSNNDGVVDKTINGKQTELSLDYLYTGSGETSMNSALLIQDDLKNVGIDLTLVNRKSSERAQMTNLGDYDLSSAGRTLNITLWNPSQEYHTNSGNRTGYGNASTDALIDDILTNNDEVERNRDYRELQKRIYEDVPEIPLFVPKGRMAIHKRFETELTPLYPNVMVAKLRLKDSYH